MKPSHTPATTAGLPIFLASCMTVASTSLAVHRAAHDLQQPITFAGLKKCRPTTSCGRCVNAAMRLTSSVEVLVARIAPGFRDAIELTKTLFFTPQSSNTASMTRSASSNRHRTAGVSRPRRCSSSVWRQLALLDRVLVVLADRRRGLVERRLALDSVTGSRR